MAILSVGEILQEVFCFGNHYASLFAFGLPRLKMATGRTAGLEGHKMEFDKETGEMVMRFKLPVQTAVILFSQAVSAILPPLAIPYTSRTTLQTKGKSGSHARLWSKYARLPGLYAF